MAKEDNVNSYENVRKQRLLDNKQRFEELGLLKLSKSLSEVTKSDKKPQERRRFKPKLANSFVIEPRRSSRERNTVSYREDWSSLGDVDLPRLNKRSRSDSSWTSYLARPVEEVKSATDEERTKALISADKLQSNLQSGKPSFVKSMVRSHVYSCFWLGLPRTFCVDYLPKSTTGMVLENEEGMEYDAVFISSRTGLSGGWRAFALDHKLDDGDALVFELIEPTRFKVHIVRAFDCDDQDGDQEDNVSVEEVEGEAEKETDKKVAKRGKKSDDGESKNSAKSKKEDNVSDEEVEGEAEKETNKKAAKRGKKSDNGESKNSAKSKKEDNVSVEEIEGEAEKETAKKVAKKGKKSDNGESKNSTKSKKEKSPQVVATRRSLRLSN